MKSNDFVPQVSVILILFDDAIVLFMHIDGATNSYYLRNAYIKSFYLVKSYSVFEIKSKTPTTQRISSMTLPDID